MSDKFSIASAENSGLRLEIGRPTDAAVEAMAERLWDVWRESAAANRAWRLVPWISITKADMNSPSGFARAAFRAMAREALRTEPGGDEVRG